jgi:hypothetical protein
MVFEQSSIGSNELLPRYARFLRNEFSTMPSLFLDENTRLDFKYLKSFG